MQGDSPASAIVSASSTSPAESPTPSEDASRDIVRTVLSNGSKGYSYAPELAYIDPGGTVWLVGAGPEPLGPGIS